MKRNLIVVIICLTVLFIVGLCFERIIDFVGNFLLVEFEEAEKEREASKYGWSIGKDTIISLGEGKFSIEKCHNYKVLSVAKEDKSSDTVLEYVSKYKKIAEKLYVISEFGVCVIDEKTNLCRVLLLVQGKEILDEDITYLSSFEEFSKDEQKCFSLLDVSHLGTEPFRDVPKRLQTASSAYPIPGENARFIPVEPQ